MAGQDRFQTLNFTTGTIAAGGTVSQINQAIGLWRLNICKIKIVPNGGGVGTSTYQLFKKDTYLSADLVFDSGARVGTFVYR